MIFKSPLKNITNNIFFVHKIWIHHGFLHCFYNVLCYMFNATLKHTIKQKYFQTKLEKRMFCQIWQFQLRNTLKLSQRRKEISRNPQHSFSKLRCFFFLRHFDVVFHMFMAIKKTFNWYKSCSLDKTGEGNVVSDLAISPQKYPKIGTQEIEKCQGTLFFKIALFFYGVLTLFCTCLGALIRPFTKKKM